MAWNITTLQRQGNMILTQIVERNSASLVWHLLRGKGSLKTLQRKLEMSKRITLCSGHMDTYAPRHTNFTTVINTGLGEPSKKKTEKVGLLPVTWSKKNGKKISIFILHFRPFCAIYLFMKIYHFLVFFWLGQGNPPPRLGIGPTFSVFFCPAWR